MAWLVNSAQVEKFRKNQKNVVVLDATWDLSADNLSPREAFEERHIVGARFFDMTAFCDPQACHAKMVTRDQEKIATQLGELGITNDHKIIFYDRSQMRTSCRALWMMKLFGHNPNLLYILDGGFAAWEKHGGKVESGLPTITEKKYIVDYQARYIRTLIQMKTNLHEPSEQVVDVRHPVRFAGGAESNPNLRTGHIPGSYSFPFTVLLDAEGKFKSPEQIRKQLLGIGLDLKSPVVTTCGSGTTAPILNFMLDLLGVENNSVYNGSWTEWGCQHSYTGERDVTERPVETCFS